jgi:hypothetical protein
VNVVVVMAMPVVVMAMMMMVMAVPVMVAMPVMAMMAMSVAVTAMTAGEGLTRDRQRSSCQRQSSESGRHDLLDPGHKHLLGCAARGSLCDGPT